MTRAAIWQSLFFLAVAPLLLTALDPTRRLSQYQKRHWQIEDGLPHNYVNAIAQGPDGYLWVATDGGLARFDGRRFTPIPSTLATRLDRRWIMAALPERNGAGGVWIGTYDGHIYRLAPDGKALAHTQSNTAVQGLFEDTSGRLWYDSGGIHMWPPPAGGGPPRTIAGCPNPNQGNAWSVFAQDRDGAVWIATPGALCRVSGGERVERFPAPASAGDILALTQDPRTGDLWAGTSRGLFRLLPEQNGKLVFVPGTKGPVSTIRIDRDGSLWAGTWGNGLYRLLPQTGAVDTWTSRDGLPDDFIRALFEDREGNLWIGSRSGGLLRWRDTIIDTFGIPEGLRGQFASAVVGGEGSGTMFFGTYRSGLYRFDGGVLRLLPNPVPDLDLVIGSLAPAAGGGVWIGHWRGLIRHDGDTRGSSHTTPVPCQAPPLATEPRTGALWAGCNGSLYRYPPQGPDGSAPLLPNVRVNAILAAPDGFVWTATSLGLARWAPGGKAPAFIGTFNGDHEIRFLSEAPDHRVWATTAAGELVRIEPDTRFRTLDARHGLPASHPLFKPIEDDTGTLWISSPRGIFEIPGDQLREWSEGRRTLLEPIVHDLEDGMRSIECHGASQPGGWLERTPRGPVLWFPTVKGFARVRPWMRRALPPPEVRIESTALNGGMSMNPAPEPVRLPAGSNDLEVRFTALRFGAPEHLQFRYRLADWSPDWIAAAGDRTLHLTGLPPGSYTLEIAARDDTAAWPATAPARLAVEQLPRFYQTAAFRLLLLAAAMAAAVLTWRWRMRVVRARYALVMAERNRIAREWHDTLLAGLSGIGWQLEATRHQLDAAPQRIPRLIEDARGMVDHVQSEARRIIWDLRDSDPSAGTVRLDDAVREYLEQIRRHAPFDGALETRGIWRKLEPDVELNALRVAQEAIANAAHHSGATHVSVTLEYAPRSLTVRIADDGSGFDPALARPGHFGITGMRERVLSFGGAFDLRSASGQGTVVEARFPLPVA